MSSWSSCSKSTSFPRYLLSSSSHAYGTCSILVPGVSFSFHAAGVCGSGGRRGWGRLALHDGQDLLWCKRIISFERCIVNTQCTTGKESHFSFVFKQIVNFSVVGTVALVFLQNSFYITSKESLWFSPNTVHWLFSNTVSEIKRITKACLSSF